MKLDGHTLDIKELNIQKLKQLFPESFTDGKFDVAKMAQLLGDYNEEAQEKYDFTWHGKGKALKMSQTPSMGTLRPSKADSKDWDNTRNLYIEGDNLEVLKLLQKSYYSKVKMIYIDPPYNTGKDFVYKDNFKDNLENYKELTSQVDGEGFALTSNPETSGRYHTDWLNMMYPRLRLARNLLTDDGVIFISIDDNEVHNLRKICDEVFGEDNVELYVWNLADFEESSFTKTASNSVRFEHEYIVACFRNNVLLNRYLEYRFINREDFDNIDNDPRGPWMSGNISRNAIKSTSGSKYFTITTPTGIKYTRNWTISKEEYSHLLNENRLYFSRNGDGVPRLKIFKNEPSMSIQSSMFSGLKSSITGKNQIVELFQINIFDFPKPTNLLKRLLLLSTNKDSIILDFFSGSATTAHAVMQLNAEDGGNRKHIMVQLPETTDEKSEAYKAGYKNICEIGKERIRRAGEQIKADLQEKWEQATEEERKEMKNPAELDTGFKVFQLDTSNIKRWNPSEDLDAAKLDLFLNKSIDNYVEGRTERDVLYEVILKMGLELTYPIDEVVSPKGTKIYSVALGALMVCLDDKIDLDVADKMIELRQELQPETWRVLFKDNGFIDDQVKTNIRETLKSAGLAEDAFTTL